MLGSVNNANPAVTTNGPKLRGQSRAVVVATGRYRRHRAGLRRRLPGDAGGNRHPLRQSVPVPWRRRAGLHSGIERLAQPYQGAGEPGWAPGPRIT